MRLLLDTHALIWAVEQPAKLGPAAHKVLQDPANDILVSAGTIWEIAIKAGLNKLNLSQPFRIWIDRVIADLGAVVLPITVDHAEILATLPHHHRDPFDRLLVGQALAEQIPIVSADAALDPYGMARIW